MQRIHIFMLLIFIGLTAGCDPSDQPVGDSVGPEAWLPLKIGETAIEVQVALTPSQQKKGLMYRESLPENSGMLFPHRNPGRMSFWMSNTPIPLDIGFFDSKGLLLEVHRMVPYDMTHTVSHGKDLQYALEMNAGWFSRNGVYPGERLDLNLLAEALEKRGADPRDFGLGD